MENKHSQFVIQEHSRQNEPVHWDLMLEADGALRTYRLDLPPEQLAERACTATRIHDHPLRFLTYQGSVNKGLGSVRIADSGMYSVIEQSTKSRLLCFDGKLLSGEFSLKRKKGDSWEFRPSPNDGNREE
ncbi:MAG: DNA polymerase ligase N-terminal domain-containing protein, partial [Planctomycetota bacterium]